MRTGTKREPQSAIKGIWHLGRGGDVKEKMVGRFRLE